MDDPDDFSQPVTSSASANLSWSCYQGGTRLSIKILPDPCGETGFPFSLLPMVSSMRKIHFFTIDKGGLIVLTIKG
jgi:hypothetical protein